MRARRIFIALLICLSLAVIPALSAPALAQGGETSISVFTASQPAPFWLGYTGRTGDATFIFGAIHCALLTQDSDFNLRPDLAERWELSEDGRSYTFYLNPNARWHDGTPVTAADVEFSWVVFATPQARTENRTRPPVFQAVLGGAAVAESAAQESVTGYADTVKYEGIEIIDDHTIRFTLTSPNPLWLLTIGDGSPNGMIIPKHIMEDVPWNDWPSHEMNTSAPVGCGSYRFVQAIEGQYVELEAFDDYHLGRPAIDRIYVKSWLTGQVAAAQLESGELDLVLGLSIDDATRLGANPGIVISSTLASAAYQLSINTDLITDPRVRLAMVYALDREGINEAVFNGLGRVQECCLFQSWAIPPDQEVRPYDPDRARELLREAGWDSNQVLDILYPVGFRYADVLMPIVQAQLAEVGIQTTLRPEESTAHRESLITRHDWYLWYNQSANMQPDPGSFTLWECRPAPTSGWRYCDDHMNDLWERGRSTVDPAERTAIYQEIQSIFYEQVPAVDIVVPPSVFGLSSRLQGFTPTASMFRCSYNIYQWSVSQ